MRRRRARAAAVSVAAAGAALAIGLAPAYAWWSDIATPTAPTITAGVPAPTLNCGALGLLSVTFNWTAVPGATNYTLTYTGGSQTVTGTSYTVVTVISGGTATVRANAVNGSNTWTSAASNSRTFTVAVASLCS